MHMLFKNGCPYFDSSAAEYYSDYIYGQTTKNSRLSDSDHWLCSDRHDMVAFGQRAEYVFPFTDHHNDMISLYIIRDEFGFIVSDGCYIIPDILDCGINMFDPKHKKMIDHIMNSHKTHCTDAEIWATAESRHDLADVINDVLMTCIYVCAVYTAERFLVPE